MKWYIETYLKEVIAVKSPYGKTQVHSNYLNTCKQYGVYPQAREVLAFIDSLGFEVVKSDDYFKQIFEMAANSKQTEFIIDDPAIDADTKFVLDAMLATINDERCDIDKLVTMLSSRNYSQQVIDKVVGFVQYNVKSEDVIKNKIYSKLDSNIGTITVGAHIHAGDVLIGKFSNNTTTSE